MRFIAMAAERTNEPLVEGFWYSSHVINRGYFLGRSEERTQEDQPVTCTASTLYHALSMVIQPETP